MNVEVWVRRSFVRVSAPIDGGQCGWREELANSVGRALLAWDVAFSGSVGCCGIAHDYQRRVWMRLCAWKSFEDKVRLPLRAF